MVYKLAPDWYFLEAANVAAGRREEHFKSMELAKEESEKYTDSKLPTIASKISQLGVGVGISPQFMQKETLKLLNAIEKFIKAIQKRGF